MSETLDVGGLSFQIRRSSRRKTLGLTVDRGGELLIHAPETAEAHDLTRWTRTKLLWVHRKLALKEMLAPKVREPEFVSGESFSYLGRTYRLKVVERQDVPLRFDGERFYLRSDAKARGAEHFHGWFVASGNEWIAKRVKSLARRVGSTPTRIEVRELRYRWGSCTKNGAVLFNWRLLQLPVRLADYVIAHELAHLLEAHHGPDFWRVLDRALPDWQTRQDELMIQAQFIYWCRPTMQQ